MQSSQGRQMQKTTEQLLEETLEILTSFTDVQVDQFIEELEPEEVIALNEGFYSSEIQRSPRVLVIG